jgi:hypothetical protein
MDIVRQIEDVPKGSGDKPKKDVLVSDAGELDIPEQVDAEGKQIPFRCACRPMRTVLMCRAEENPSRQSFD